METKLIGEKRERMKPCPRCGEDNPDWFFIDKEGNESDVCTDCGRREPNSRIHFEGGFRC